MAEEMSGELYIKLGKEILDRVERTYGAVHKSTPVTMKRDYIVFNELTFLNHNTGKIVSLYTSFSDSEMEAEYNRYASKYGS
jgi:hypothetical protein